MKAGTDVLRALERYGNNAYDKITGQSKLDGKIICGYTFHPGIFRNYVRLGFSQLYNRCDGKRYKIKQLIKKGCLDEGYTHVIKLSDRYRQMSDSELDGVMPHDRMHFFRGAFTVLDIDKLLVKRSNQYWIASVHRAYEMADCKGEIKLETVYYSSFTWYYAIETTVKELTRNEMYRVSNGRAYSERSRFYSIGVLVDLMNVLCSTGVASDRVCDLRTAMHALTEDVSAFLKLAHHLLNLPDLRTACKIADRKGIEKPDSFVDAYVGTGLFYSIRSAIAFGGASYRGATGESAFEMSSKLLNTGLDDMFRVYRDVCVGSGISDADTRATTPSCNNHAVVDNSLSARLRDFVLCNYDKTCHTREELLVALCNYLGSRKSMQLVTLIKVLFCEAGSEVITMHTDLPTGGVVGVGYSRDTLRANMSREEHKLYSDLIYYALKNGVEKCNTVEFIIFHDR